MGAIGATLIDTLGTPNHSTIVAIIGLVLMVRLVATPNWRWFSTAIHHGVLHACGACGNVLFALLTETDARLRALVNGLTHVLDPLKIQLQ